jgi:AcrR family transcriptional regulator
MPKPTFFALPAARRDRLVEQALVEFAERSYAEASLSRIARRARIAKGSFYQYFEDKLDLYRWLLTDETPRRKRAFLGGGADGSRAGGARPRGGAGDFWTRLETRIERGMAFLVAHPRLARLSAAAADPSAIPEVRGLHQAVCAAGFAELRQLLDEGVAARALAAGVDAELATRLVAAVIGPGLTDAVLAELGAELHEILASPALRQRLGPARRQRLARAAVTFIRSGLGRAPAAAAKERR